MLNCTVRTNTVNIHEMGTLVNLQNSYNPWQFLYSQYKPSILAKKHANSLNFHKSRTTWIFKATLIFLDVFITQGQEFLKETAKRLDELLKYKNKNEFEIYIDGGINDETIKLVSKADGVVSGSFVCNNVDFNKQIEKLKIN